MSTVVFTDQYMSLARAMHAEDEICNSNYDVPFDECATREWDIATAAKILDRLRKDGWYLARDGQGTAEMGL